MATAKAMKHYPPEFKLKVVEQVKAGASTTQVAKAHGLSVQTVYRWLHQGAGVSNGSAESGRPATPVPNADELSRLRHEVETLRGERDFLKKATVFFARDAAVGP